VSAASSRAPTRRVFALAAAAAVHIGVLSLIALSLPDQKQRPSELTVEMQAVGAYLSPADQSHGASPAKRRRPDASPRSTTSPNVRIASPAMAVAPPAPVATGLANRPAVDNRVQGEANGGDGGLQAALRSSIGCDYADLARLTPAEREHCQQRLGRAAQEARALPVGPSDPGKRARLDHEIRVDDAWRTYRRSNRMDDYPGLRTIIPALKPLFGDEPLNAADVTPPPQ